MRKLFLTLLAVSAIVAGCSKSDEGEPKAPRVLEVRFPNNTVLGSRAVEVPAELIPETSINNAIVYLLAGNNVASAHAVTDDEIRANSKKFDNVSPTVNAVLIVANYPNSDLNALKALTTVSAIENYGFTIESQFATEGITKKTLMGKSNDFKSDTPNPDAPDDIDVYYTVEVPLSALVARFEIGNVKPGINVKNVKIEGVWINNFRNGNNATDSTLYASNHPSWVTTPNTNWAGANEAIINDTDKVLTLADYSPEQYFNAYDPSVDGTENTKVYAFQIFAGKYVPHIIMLVSGQNNEDKYFLGWLTFNKILEGQNAITNIDRNTIYRVGMGGIPVNMKDLTEKPEMAKIDLGVQCKITPWTEKNVTPGIE